jgi:ABC-type sugar transport system ATPase subunit
MAEKVLELENVVKRFQGVTAVDGIDLESTGRVHCLCGAQRLREDDNAASDRGS